MGRARKLTLRYRVFKRDGQAVPDICAQHQRPRTLRWLELRWAGVRLGVTLERKNQSIGNCRAQAVQHDWLGKGNHAGSDRPLALRLGASRSSRPQKQKDHGHAADEVRGDIRMTILMTTHVHVSFSTGEAEQYLCEPPARACPCASDHARAGVRPRMSTNEQVEYAL